MQRHFIHGSLGPHESALPFSIRTDFSSKDMHVILENLLFFNRVIGNWNRLPGDIVMPASTNSIENKRDRFLHKRGFL